MKAFFSDSDACLDLAQLLKLAEGEEIEIRRSDGAVFSLRLKGRTAASPLDIPGIKTTATTQDILDAVQDSRAD